ncbi:MAG: class I SAM-dependent methyltransferase, partial [Nitrospira sp.]
MDILCRNLAMCGLLKKRGNIYRNSPFAATILNAKHPKYRGAYVELMKHQWTDSSQLTRTVRSGRPVDHDEPEAPGYRRQFTWAMHHRSVYVAARVARQMNLNWVETLLDLGGGPGTYAMAFLARHPKLKATICDRPAALEVAKEIAARHKARKRLSYLPLNFMDEPLSGDYDVVWYSNVLHIYSPEENQALFRQVLSALSPGVRLVIQDAFLHDRERLYPEEASLFAVNMLLFT